MDSLAMDSCSSLNLVPVQNWNSCEMGMRLKSVASQTVGISHPVSFCIKPDFCVLLYKNPDRLGFYWSKVVKFNQ